MSPFHALEDVLDQYEKPYNSAEPVVCMDEQPYQMLDDVRPSQRAAPGRIAKQDYEYRRCGTCSIFVAVEPAAGRRFVQARRHRTRSDFACFVRDLLKHYPHARRIHLVLDNLNTHNARSLIEYFDLQRAEPLLKRIVWHHTPKHASWLNMAEIEISVLTKQCLRRRLATLEAVQREAAVWSRDRNRRGNKGVRNRCFGIPCRAGRGPLERLAPPELPGLERKRRELLTAMSFEGRLCPSRPRR